jgi:phosphoribosylformylglycinamidine synthase
MRPRVAVVQVQGTNCDEETAHAFAKGGGDPVFIHMNQLRARTMCLADFSIIALSGGFSYGDDIASGKIFAIELISFLRDELLAVIERGGLIIGICNGFQVLVRTGILPFQTPGTMHVTLAINDSGRFQCHPVPLVTTSHPCVFTQNLDADLTFQIAHGEGKFLAHSDVLERIERENLVVLRYQVNPNGSQNDIAGICDSTRRVFGLMPHPERAVEVYQSSNWRRGSHGAPQGLPIFENAVRYARGL